MIVNNYAEKWSGSQKLTKLEKQVMAIAANEIELLRDLFACNLKSQKMDLKSAASGVKLHQSIEGTKLKRSRSFPVTTNDSKPARFYQGEADIGTQKTTLEVCTARLRIQQEFLEDENFFGGKDLV